MSLTVDELARFRSYVPVSIIEDDSAVQVRVNALGSWQAAALEYLRTFESELMTNPSSFSVPEYSESWGANFALLRARIVELEGAVSADSGGIGFSTGQLVRHGRDRSTGYR